MGCEVGIFSKFCYLAARDPDKRIEELLGTGMGGDDGVEGGAGIGFQGAGETIVSLRQFRQVPEDGAGEVLTKGAVAVSGINRGMSPGIGAGGTFAIGLGDSGEFATDEFSTRFNGGDFTLPPPVQV